MTDNRVILINCSVFPKKELEKLEIELLKTLNFKLVHPNYANLLSELLYIWDIFA